MNPRVNTYSKVGSILTFGLLMIGLAGCFPQPQYPPPTLYAPEPTSVQEADLLPNVDQTVALNTSEAHIWHIDLPDTEQAELHINYVDWIPFITLTDNNGVIQHDTIGIDAPISLDTENAPYTLNIAERYGGGEYRISVAVPESVPTVSETELGTGDVQVTLYWNTVDDLDLHVTDPSGERIYYRNPRSRSGGELDVDANPGCGRPTTNAIENVFWPANQSPSGDYLIQVVLYSYCRTIDEPVPFTVRLRIDGQPDQLFEDVMPVRRGETIDIIRFTKP